MRTGSLEVLERRPVVEQGRPPLLFVHGFGHGAWCWEPWLEEAAAAGYPALAVSLRGHAGSPGRLRTSRLSGYVADVVGTATALPCPAVLIGHSMGGLVVQRALTRYAAYAAVLIAPTPARPAVGSALHIARQHPLDALRMVVGTSLHMRPEYLFHALEPGEAERYAGRCGPESPLAQYQMVMHRPAGPPLGAPPVLVMATPEDRLIPLPGIRETAARYGARLVEFPGMGHDLMLDAGREEPLRTMLEWLATLPAPGGR